MQQQPSPQVKYHGYSCYVLNQLETSPSGLYNFQETLRPLVAPLLCSGCYSLRLLGLLKCVPLASIVSVNLVVISIADACHPFLQLYASSNGNGCPCLLSLLPILCSEIIVLCDPESTIASTSSPSTLISRKRVGLIAATSPQVNTCRTDMRAFC